MEADISSQAVGLASSADFSLINLFLKADIIVKTVIISLIACSIYSWAIIFDKIKMFKKINLSSEEFEEKFWRSKSAETFYNNLPSEMDDPMAMVFKDSMQTVLKSRSKSKYEIITPSLKASNPMIINTKTDVGLIVSIPHTNGAKKIPVAYMKAMINSKKYDVVHAWNIPSSFVMKKINAKKKILSVHGIYGQQIEKIHSKTTSKIGKKAEEEAFKIPDVFTTDSKYVQNFYKTQLEIDFVYLPAPLDVSKFDNIPDVTEKKNQVIYIGRDSYEKGIDILKNIEDKINGNVVYCTDLPWDETMKKLKESAILVIPSRMESIPQVIKEAFYLKKPVIATDVGGIPEMIQNNVTGILIPPENPQKMLEAINTLLEDKSLNGNGISTISNCSYIIIPPLIFFIVPLFSKNFF